MSWSFSVPATPVADFAVALDEAKAAYLQAQAENDFHLTDEATAQVDAACAAAEAIVATGALGGAAVTASLGGHANPEHAPAPGWTNDTVSVYVTYADVPAVASVPAEPAPVPDIAPPAETAPVATENAGPPADTAAPVTDTWADSPPAAAPPADAAPATPAPSEAPPAS